MMVCTVMMIGDVLAGSLSDEGLLLYLRALQTLLPLLPVPESCSRPEVNSDSEDDDDAGIHPPPMQVRYIHTDTSTHKVILTFKLLGPSLTAATSGSAF